MEINLIVAVNKNNDKYGIGKNGTIPWNSPQDMKFFRSCTIGHTIIMGRATYESIGKPLPRRRNIVISTTLKDEKVEIFPSLKEAIENSAETIFIIGGESIYKEAIENIKLNKIYVSFIEEAFDCDRFFPYLEMKKKYKMIDILKNDTLYVEIFEEK